MCRKLGWFGLAILLLAALAFPVLAEGGARLTEQGEMATQQLDLLTVPVMEGEGWKSADVAGYALYREKHADGCIYIQEMEKPEELGYTAGKDAASDFYQKVLSQLKYYFPGERTRYEVFDLGEGYTITRDYVTSDQTRRHGGRNPVCPGDTGIPDDLQYLSRIGDRRAGCGTDEPGRAD